jgi:hypothetical protein
VRASPARRLDQRAAERGAEPRAPEPLHAVLALQRAAGNRAVAGILARDALDLGMLVPASSTTPAGRRRLVPTLTGAEVATAWLQLRDGSGIDLPGGSFLIDDGERAELLPLLYERKESFFVDFADGRRPLFAAMQAATDPAARLAAIQALSAYDAPHLAELIAMRDAMKGRWLLDDTDARDAVLAAIQLQAATDAQGELSADWKTVRQRVTKATGMGVDSQWCGMFSGDHLIRAALDSDFRHSFMHTHNVEAFFTYHPERFPTRIPKWIWDDDGWQSVKDLHNARGSLRSWLSHDQMTAGTGLDIQPGDMVLIDPGLDGDPDHIVLAASYDPHSGLLITIGGNDSGYVLAPPGKHTAPKAGDKRETAEQATGLELAGGGGGKVAVGVHHVGLEGKATRAAVYGVGRPSLLDLEEHTYAFKPQDKPPPPPKGAK